MTQPSIRDMVDQKVKLFRDLDSLDPIEVAREVVELSSLWASVNKELIERELAYNIVLKDLVIEHGTVAKATVYAKTTNEYREFLEASSYSKSIQELVRTGKKFVTLNDSIQRESKYNA